ncbi:MAG: hypothetical protein AAF554_18625 [Bacteroidota bacterium]
MTWAEFQLRSYGFWEDRKFLMYMTREVSYEVHGLNYMLGKKRPPRKNRFWDIEGKSQGLEDKKIKAMEKALLEYRKRTNG